MVYLGDSALAQKLCPLVHCFQSLYYNAPQDSISALGSLYTVASLGDSIKLRDQSVLADG